MSKTTQKKPAKGTHSTPFTDKFIEFCDAHFQKSIVEHNKEVRLSLWGQEQATTEEPLYVISVYESGEKWIKCHFKDDPEILKNGLATARSMLNKHVSSVKYKAVDIEHALEDIQKAMCLCLENVFDNESKIRSHISFAAFHLNRAGYNFPVISTAKKKYIFSKDFLPIITNLYTVATEGANALLDEQPYLVQRPLKLRPFDHSSIVALLDHADALLINESLAPDTDRETRKVLYEDAATAITKAAILCLESGVESLAIHSAARGGFGWMRSDVYSDTLRRLLPEPNVEDETSGENKFRFMSCSISKEC
ncbi:hypothetical protein [Halodesulfovibrio sp.]|jgi:hypothetical protein|uniref:hypothetical protein n=1 Tax=Halodesulfovibrio sp. TaxID=1912772 RepID=UPI0025F9A523|nr:hypothetical protein [Halodesulfovibrio sp.]MCT4533774.1 hypothetical protein [Halodesulfovibrio sp.]